MSTTKPIRAYEDVQKFKNYFLKKGEYRNYLLVSVCLNTALRIRDVLKIKWCDVIELDTGKIKDHLDITETKTEKNAVIKLNERICAALRLYIKHNGIKGEYVFEGKDGSPITRMCAFKIIKKAGAAVGLEYEISPHSLRKTFGYHAVKNGTPPAVIMQIYNHSSYEVTKRYLGITQDEKDDVYMAVAL